MCVCVCVNWSNLQQRMKIESRCTRTSVSSISFSASRIVFHKAGIVFSISETRRIIPQARLDGACKATCRSRFTNAAFLAFDTSVFTAFKTSARNMGALFELTSSGSKILAYSARKKRSSTCVALLSNMQITASVHFEKIGGRSRANLEFAEPHRISRSHALIQEGHRLRRARKGRGVSYSVEH